MEKPTEKEKPEPPKTEPKKEKQEPELTTSIQKKLALYPEAVFAFDIVLRELQQAVEFTPLFARLPEITKQASMAIRADDDREEKHQDSQENGLGAIYLS